MEASGITMGISMQELILNLPDAATNLLMQAASVIASLAGLPAKPMVPMVALEAGSAGRRANGRSSGNGGGPPPPPPPDAKEDPRAAAGKKVSYHDMDLVAEGDVELTY
ncbi:hypothetical protein FIBSPDRAFT_959069 [Athelia psychrophila]|uniref:Uncharacterized protein n=1 Tax=Athelia psychrophila TaxID=1759441 RepID=A0A166DUQ1_9AGAM|nr:hypothetical protein FIBSPDRAFT_959069 [Fibularhizoctonia sp. CBS 109695]